MERADVMLSIQSLTELDAAIAQSRLAAQALGQLTGWEKTLHHLAEALDNAQDDILEANTLDLEACLDMAVPERVIDWLKLNPERLCVATASLRHLAHLGAIQHPGASPIAPIPGKQWEPLGVVALMYEALPELAIFAAGMCLLTGNSLILKGGNEASQTNQAIAHILHGVIERSPLPESIIQVISTSEGEPTRRWLMQSTAIDLIIPYGRASLVQQIQREALSPVLSTHIGNCFLYWAPSGDEHIAAQMIIASHQGAPDPVNSIETVLVDAQISTPSLLELLRSLREARFTCHQDGSIDAEGYLESVDPQGWSPGKTPKTIHFRQVPDLKIAVTTINQQSSGHGDCLVTESYGDSRYFTRMVQSATIYVNASPRFSRSPAQASQIALGMSAQRGLYGGRVGLHSLLAAKTVIQG
ncbi:MAG: aldehyde dehydrogenase family protein [Cyanobacteria bacterium]|nr:aldehyde dehydrogenase family protein [Cyanobacteriota bacterium]